jgi:hypothetical protein
MSGRRCVVTNFVQDELIEKCEENPWLQKGGIPFEDDPLFDLDSPFQFSEYDTIAKLLARISEGNWSIRQGFIYKSVAFINQTDGGDEWWSVKKFSDGRLYSFDSITFEPMIRSGICWTGKSLIRVILDMDKADTVKDLNLVWRKSVPV